jgi:hypothetical protein
VQGTIGKAETSGDLRKDREGEDRRVADELEMPGMERRATERAKHRTAMTAKTARMMQRCPF